MGDGEAQIEVAIESMCIEARSADPPSPSELSKRRLYGRRLRERGALPTPSPQGLETLCGGRLSKVR